MKAIRWSENDRYFGRFTYARCERQRELALMLGSGDGDDYPGCRLRLALGSRTLIIALPAIIKPFRRWTDTSRAGWSKPPHGYWTSHEREYGFCATEGALHLRYGEQTDEWPGSKSKCWFYPWQAHKQIRRSLYDVAGMHFADVPEGLKWTTNRYEATRALEEACPVARFEFADFDGERIVATCRLEEREWTRGRGLFRLLFIGRNRINRELDLRFSSEVGRRKGSYKGGTVGHSTSVLSGELHEAAFRRYCEKEGLTFIGDAVAPAAPGKVEQ